MISNSRIIAIDALRGLAAVSVAMFHIGGHSETASTGLVAVRTVTQHGWVGVPVFFVISGFVIAHSMKTAKVDARYAGNYILRREARLAPPYWAAILFAVGMQAIVSRMVHEPIEWPSAGLLLDHAVYLQNILGLDNLTVGLWTLCIEVQFYLAFLVLSWICQRCRVPLWPLAVALGIAAMSLPVTINPHRPGVWDCAYRSLVPNLPLFALGVVVSLQARKLVPPVVLGVLYAAVAVRLCLWFEPTLLAGLVASLLILGNVNGYHTMPSNQVAVFLGSISYSLYLIHAPVARMVFLGMRRFAHWDAAETVFGCTLAMAVAIAAAYAMWLTVERPSIRLSARLKQPS